MKTLIYHLLTVLSTCLHPNSSTYTVDSEYLAGNFTDSNNKSHYYLNISNDLINGDNDSIDLSDFIISETGSFTVSTDDTNVSISGTTATVSSSINTLVDPYEIILEVNNSRNETIYIHVYYHKAVLDFIDEEISTNYDSTHHTNYIVNSFYGTFAEYDPSLSGISELSALGSANIMEFKNVTENGLVPLNIKDTVFERNDGGFDDYTFVVRVHSGSFGFSEVYDSSTEDSFQTSSSMGGYGSIIFNSNTDSGIFVCEVDTGSYMIIRAE